MVALAQKRRRIWAAQGKAFLLECLTCNRNCEQLDENSDSGRNIGNCQAWEQIQAEKRKEEKK